MPTFKRYKISQKNEGKSGHLVRENVLYSRTARHLDETHADDLKRLQTYVSTP